MMKQLKQQLETTLITNIDGLQWFPRGGAAPLAPLFPASAVELGSADELRDGLLPGPWHGDDR